jgi:hypothetical protein
MTIVNRMNPTNAARTIPPINTETKNTAAPAISVSSWMKGFGGFT